MKKALLVFLLSTTPFWAQPKHPVKPLPRLYVVTPTVAYNNQKESKAVGIFLRGAMVDQYEMIDYGYKITLKTGETVYVTRTYNLKESLNAKDDYEPSPAVVVDDDQYYGSPHLFTTVASLKIRELPNSSSAVVGNMLNGTVVPIYYYPYDEEAWIPVQIDNKEGYIPVKYVGKRPVLDDLISDYKNAATAEDQKKYAERILELGWNSERTETAKALKIFADFAKKNNEPNIAELSLLQATALENVSNNNPEIIQQLINDKMFGFTLNNEMEPEKGFSKSTLEKHLGKITKQNTEMDDCGLSDFETNIYFTSAECIGHDVNKTYHLRSMAMVNTNGFKIKNTFLNAASTETEFLKAASGLIDFIDALRNTYYISIDYMSYEFTFKNGYLIKVAALYYC